MPGRPHHTEKFKRCVEQVMAKGNDESSAYAICTTSFQDSGQEIFEAATRNLHLRGALGKVRTEKWEGRDHLVVPIVALMEGVIHAINAENPEFVPAASLIAAQDSWNGMPVVLGHPMKNGKPVSANDPQVKEQYSFGVIRGAEVHGNKLMMEALIDIAKLSRLEPELLAELEQGAHVEVSVGALVHTTKEEGTYGDKKYKARWTEISGDHLAMLPGGIGACSGEMGCGANRAACMLVTAQGFVPIERFQVMPYSAFTVLEGLSLDERLRAVELAVRKKWPISEASNGSVPYSPGAWPKQVYDDHVIVAMDNGELLWCDYTVNKDNEVTLGEPKKVKQVYVTAIGARHSMKDVEIIQGVHDHTMALGAKCSPENCVKISEAKPRMIRYEGGKWRLYSKDGRRILGTHETEAEAKAHESALEVVRKRLEGKAPCGCQTATCSCNHREAVHG